MASPANSSGQIIDHDFPMANEIDSASVSSPDDQSKPESDSGPSSTEHASSFEELLEQGAVSAESLHRSLLRSISDFERSFRKNFPVLWISTLIGPVAVTIGILTVIGLVWGWELSGKFVYHAFLTFFVFGRFIILGGYEGQAAGVMESISLSPSQLFFMVTYMDFMTALFVTFHMGILFRLPWAGPRIAGLVSDGKYLMDHHKWLKRLAFVGLVVFVVFPTSTTGSIGGSIFGRLLGLGRLFTVSGVLTGSVIGNGIMYYFAKEINKYIGTDSLWLKLVGIFILVIVVALLEWRFRQIGKKYLEPEE